MDLGLDKVTSVNWAPAIFSLDFFAINGITITHVVVKLEKPPALSGRIVLSAPFCEQLVKLAAGDEEATLIIGEDYSLLTCQAGTLFGKLIVADRPLEFYKLLDEMVPKNIKKKSSLMPKRLSFVLDRALVISDPAGERVHSKVSIFHEKGNVKKTGSFISESIKGKVDDTVKLERKHPDVKLFVDPHWLKVGYASKFKKVLFTEACVIMTKKNQKYLIASKST